MLTVHTAASKQWQARQTLHLPFETTSRRVGVQGHKVTGVVM